MQQVTSDRVEGLQEAGRFEHVIPNWFLITGLSSTQLVSTPTELVLEAAISSATDLTLFPSLVSLVCPG